MNIVELLLSKGANINDKTNDGVTNPHEKFCADCGAYKVMADAFTPDHKEVKTFAFVPRK